jgi:hypothetical protein
MTPFEFEDVCTSLGLNNSDVAMITGNSMRAIQFWRVGKNPVPQATAILLTGMASGNIDMDWVADQVAKFQQPVAQFA